MFVLYITPRVLNCTWCEEKCIYYIFLKTNVSKFFNEASNILIPGTHKGILGKDILGKDILGNIPSEHRWKKLLKKS